MSALDKIVGSGTSNDDDDIVDVDFSGAIEFGKLDGEYEAVVVAANPGTSKAGNPKIEFVFEVTSTKGKGALRTRHAPTTGRGAGLCKQVLKALGHDTSEPKARFKLSSMIGKPVVLTMGPQKDNDEFDEIKSVRAPKTAALGTV